MRFGGCTGKGEIVGSLGAALESGSAWEDVESDSVVVVMFYILASPLGAGKGSSQ